MELRPRASTRCSHLGAAAVSSFVYLFSSAVLRHQLSFLVLGFFGAISAAFPIAFATVHAHQQQQRHHQREGQRGGDKQRVVVPGAEPAASVWRLGGPAAVAVASALLLPYTARLTTSSM